MMNNKGIAKLLNLIGIGLLVMIICKDACILDKKEYNSSALFIFVKEG